MVTTYARLKNYYKFKYHTLFSASIYKINEEDQRSDETELFVTLNINYNLTESDHSVNFLICDWTDKYKYLILFRMLEIYVEHGMVVEKFMR